MALAEVTGQYVARTAGLQEQRVEGMAGFLVLAARLVLLEQ